MDFSRLNYAMATGKAHLDATGARGTEIESHLVGYLLAITYAEFERKNRAIMATRCGRHGDPEMLSFCTMLARKALQSIYIGDLKGVLGKFSEQCKDQFDTAVNGSPAHAAYDNIVLNRHRVAHVTGTNMTFLELETALPVARAVFDEFAIAIGLTPAEIATL